MLLGHRFWLIALGAFCIAGCFVAGDAVQRKGTIWAGWGFVRNLLSAFWTVDKGHDLSFQRNSDKSGRGEAHQLNEAMWRTPTTVTTPQGSTCICEQTLKGGCPPIRLFAYAKRQLCHCEAPSKYMDVAVW